MPDLRTTNAVTDVPAAPSPTAVEHFEASFAFEADCWDVHEAMATEDPGFVLLDVRSPELYAAGHVAGAVNLPHRRIVERNLESYASATLFVVYCDMPLAEDRQAAVARLIEQAKPAHVAYRLRVRSAEPPQGDNA